MNTLKVSIKENRYSYLLRFDLSNIRHKKALEGILKYRDIYGLTFMDAVINLLNSKSEEIAEESEILISKESETNRDQDVSALEDTDSSTALEELFSEIYKE